MQLLKVHVLCVMSAGPDQRLFTLCAFWPLHMRQSCPPTFTTPLTALWGSAGNGQDMVAVSLPLPRHYSIILSTVDPPGSHRVLLPACPGCSSLKRMRLSCCCWLLKVRQTVCDHLLCSPKVLHMFHATKTYSIFFLLSGASTSTSSPSDHVIVLRLTRNDSIIQTVSL